MWHDGINKNTDPRIILQYWDYKMNMESISYINNGRTTIYSPCSQFYFNDPYAELPLLRTYNRGIKLDGLDKNGKKSIIGMECCLWTEWVDSNTILEFNIMPRLFAFAEATWTNSINKNKDLLIEKIEKSNHFYKYYNLVVAPKNIYLAKGKNYRKEVSAKYRKDNKIIELQLAKILPNKK